MPRMSGAKALIESLKREKVEVIFGIPGGAIVPVYDALYDSDIKHILMRHEQCIAPDTKILVNDYSLVAASHMENDWHERKVLAPNPINGSLAPYKIGAYIKVDPKAAGKKVYRLITKETGRTIKASGDHPFWTPNGWKNLEEIKIGDKVAVLPVLDIEDEKSKINAIIITEDDIIRHARSFLKDESAVKEVVNGLKAKGLAPLTYSSEKVPAISRIMGHIFGNGGLSKPIFDSKEGEGSVYVFFTIHGDRDLEEIKSDLSKIGFKSCPIDGQEREKEEIGGINRRFRFRSKELWCLFEALGAPVGRKNDIAYLVPEWIMKGSRKVKREFLASLFGSDRHKIKVRSKYHISGPRLSFSKSSDLRKNAESFAHQIISMLAEFNVRAELSVEGKRLAGKYSYYNRFEIAVCDEISNVRNFLKNVGYVYCLEKEEMAAYALEYLEMIEHISEEYESKREEALRMARSGCKHSEIMRKLKISRGTLSSWLYGKPGRSGVPASLIPPFNKWLKESTCGLPPKFLWETVESIEEIDENTLIDVEIDDVHYFIANGFLVHNCAAHAADGYARASGRVGVCMSTSGPGATNLVTGIANAYMDSSPIVAITGQVPRVFIGKDAFQETDIVGITTPITKCNFQVRSAAEIPKIVKAAFYIASTGRPGPVLIDLPKDTQTEEDEMNFDEKIEFRGYRPTYDPHPLQIEKAAQLLVQSERPIIVAGGGVKSSNACSELVALAETLLAPVATTLMGKGVIPEDHPLSLGMLGMHGTIAANHMVQDADVLLAVGMRFSDRSTGNIKAFCPDGKIIHIDIDSSEIGKNIRPHVPIVADAKKALQAILNRLTQKFNKKERSAWLSRMQTLKNMHEEMIKSVGDGIKPPALMVEIRKMLPNDAIITTEVGQNQMWAALYLKAYKPRTFISSGGLGTMGFGFPAALGAKVACPDVPVVDIAGDGSFLMTEQDLASSIAWKIPVVVVILNNSVLGMVAQWQRLFYNRRYSAVDLKGIPDFVKLAESYGAQASRVQSIEEFRKAFKEAINSDVTTVIDVPISPEENVLPMVPPGNTLKDLILS
jgi:acetolactate synthase-1/2/3 large subunit